MTSWRAADERVWGAGAHDHRLPVPAPLADTGQGLSAMATVLQVYKTDFPSVSGGVDTVVCQLLRAESTEWQQCLLRVAPWQELVVERAYEMYPVSTLQNMPSTYMPAFFCCRLWAASCQVRPSDAGWW